MDDSYAAFAAVSIAGYLVAHYALHVPLTQARWILICVLVIGGAPLLIGSTLHSGPMKPRARAE